MAAPIIFNGKYSKLLTNKGILNSDGSINQNDGPINYVKYAEFEQNNVTGWSLGTTGTLTNAIPTGSPTFGSGASANLSIAATGTNPIRGSYSMSLVSSAATVAGNMVASDALTIDAADQAKVLTFKFYYQVASGVANGNFSGTSSNSFGVAVYDVTNSAWLGVAGNFAMTQNSGVGLASGTFQTGATTSQIRFVVYCANASAGAITVNFDDFFVGPQTAPIGPVVTDWQSFTPTGSWTTNTIYTGLWKRVGDVLEMQIKIASTGSPNSAVLSINLPFGLSIDNNKLIYQTNTAWTTLGYGSYSRSGVENYADIFPVVNTVNSIYVFFGIVDTTSGSLPTLKYRQITQTVPYTPANGDVIDIWLQVPIVGWSSQVVSSSDTDTRVIACRSTQVATSVPHNSTTNANISAALYDTAGMIGTNLITVPVSGVYQIFGSTTYPATSNASVQVNYNINGGSDNGLFASANSSITGITISGSDTIKLNAGDVVRLRLFQNSGSTQTMNGYISVTRISGPSVIAATESVNAKYYASANGTCNSTTPINFDSKVYDSHNAVTTGAGWKFTTPISGKFRFTVFINNSAAVNSTYISVYKNGALFDSWGYVNSTIATFSLGGTLELNAGDYIDIRSPLNSFSYQGGARPSGYPVEFCIERVGN